MQQKKKQKYKQYNTHNNNKKKKKKRKNKFSFIFSFNVAFLKKENSEKKKMQILSVYFLATNKTTRKQNI